MRAAINLVLASCGLVAGAFAADAPYPPMLPPDTVARQALMRSAGVLVGQEQLAIGQARNKRLRAGPYEWEAAVMTQDRKEPTGLRYSEQQYELSRRWRLPGKGGLDRRIGAAALEVGENAYADAWHESARVLLAGWFSWLREESAAQTLAAQAELGQRELEAVTRRLARGDAARIDLQRVEAEQGRLLARQSEAVRKAEAARLELLRDFPDLDVKRPAHQPSPEALPGSDEEWIARIVDENHEIELANARAEEASIAAARARLDRLPDPLVGLHYSDNIDQNRNVLGIRIAVPLGFSGRSADAAVARSQSAVASAEADQARRGVEAAARVDVLNVHSRLSQWQRLSQAAAQASAAADAIGRAYELGELGLAELLAVRRQQLDARLEAGTASLDAHEALARLRLDAHQVWAPGHRDGDAHHHDH